MRKCDCCDENEAVPDPPVVNTYHLRLFESEDHEAVTPIGSARFELCGVCLKAWSDNEPAAIQGLLIAVRRIREHR